MINLDQELAKAAQALENLAKASPAPALEGEDMTNAEFLAILDTIKTVGPEGLKKSLPTLTERQLALVKAVLEKATSIQAEAVKQPEPLHDLASKELKKPEGGADEEDEKLVKEEMAEHPHQGDDSEFEGQVIKSEANPDEKADADLAEKVEALVDKHEEENKDAEKKEDDMAKSLREGKFTDEQLSQFITRAKARNLSKSDCMGALEQYGYPREKMEKMYDGEAVPEEKQDKPDPKDKAEAQADKEVKEGLKTDDGLKDEEKKAEEKPEAKQEAKPEEMAAPAPEKAPEADKKEEAKPPFQKSVSWKTPVAPFNQAATKRGRNCHYNVDSAIAAAEAETSKMKKSGNWHTDPYAAKPETLAKSTEKKVSINDIIEQGLDFDPCSLELAKSRKDWKPVGAFNVQSFSIEQLAKSLNVSVESLKKALPRGEGSRGGHIIGHTTTGKPIYADPKHPEHNNFHDEDHYDAHLAHTMHQSAHEKVLSTKPHRGNAAQHVMSADRVQHHSKSSKAHLSRVKAKDLTTLHPHLKTQGDLHGHAKGVATSKFKKPEDSQVSTKQAPEQKA